MPKTSVVLTDDNVRKLDEMKDLKIAEDRSNAVRICINAYKLPEHELTNVEILAKIEGNPSRYVENGKTSITAIMTDFGVGMNRAYLINDLLQGKKKK